MFVFNDIGSKIDPLETKFPLFHVIGAHMETDEMTIRN